MSSIGFPTRLGSAVDFKTFKGEPVGRIAVRQFSKVDRLDRSPQRCPICSGEMFTVPSHIVMGRVVAITENGVTAVDPVPESQRIIHCFACDVTFYEEKQG